jgi:hypothetical protein
MRILELVISLTFIYLLYSLLGTIVQEFVAQLLGLRARMLLKAISRMLDKVKTKDSFKDWILSPFTETEKFFKPFSGKPTARKFFNQPSIKFLGENSLFSRPSYISADNFSTTLIRMLRGPGFDGTKPPMMLIKSALDSNTLHLDHETLGYLKCLYVESSDDIGRFKSNIEQWFNETMERSTGWYKRQTRFILFIIGFVLAVIFNIDTIEITSRLSKDDGLRNQIVRMAEGFNDSVKVSKSDFYQNLAVHLTHDSTVNDTGTVALKYEMIKVLARNNDSVMNLMGLGWKEKCGPPKKCLFKCMETSCHYALPQKSPWQAFLGWLITALAISLGSSFWYDLLNKLLKLRSTAGVTQPEKKENPSSPSENTIDPRLRKG